MPAMSLTQCLGALSLALLAIVVGCGGDGGQLYQNFGTYDLGEGLRLRVSTRGMTLVEYEIRDLSMNRALVSDSVGRDLGRWFLFWDDHRRLWVHSRDKGTRVWVSTGTGKFYKHSLIMGSPFMATVPPRVARSLPLAERRALGLVDASQ